MDTLFLVGARIIAYFLNKTLISSFLSTCVHFLLKF